MTAANTDHPTAPEAVSAELAERARRNGLHQHNGSGPWMRDVRDAGGASLWVVWRPARPDGAWLWSADTNPNGRIAKVEPSESAALLAACEWLEAQRDSAQSGSALRLSAALARLGWVWCAAPGHPGDGWYEYAATGVARVSRVWGPLGRDRGAWTYFHDQSREFQTADDCVLWVDAGCPSLPAAPAPTAAPTAPVGDGAHPSLTAPWVPLATASERRAAEVAEIQGRLDATEERLAAERVSVRDLRVSLERADGIAASLRDEVAALIEQRDEARAGLDKRVLREQERTADATREGRAAREARDALQTRLDATEEALTERTRERDAYRTEAYAGRDRIAELEAEVYELRIEGNVAEEKSRADDGLIAKLTRERDDALSAIDVVRAQREDRARVLAEARTTIMDTHVALDAMRCTKAPDLDTPAKRIRYAADAWRVENEEGNHLGDLCQKAHDALTAGGIPNEGTPAERIGVLLARLAEADAEIERLTLEPPPAHPVDTLAAMARKAREDAARIEMLERGIVGLVMRLGVWK